MNDFSLNRMSAANVAVESGQLDVATQHRRTVAEREHSLPFDAHLQMARRTFSQEAITTEEDAVRKGANELVATAFFKPIFKLLREDPLRSDVIPLSAGEKMFAPLLHAEFANRIVQANNFPIADAVVRQLLGPRSEAGSAQQLRAAEGSKSGAVPPEVSTRSSPETKVKMYD